MTWQRTVLRLFPPQTVQLPNDGAAVGIQNMDGHVFFLKNITMDPSLPSVQPTKATMRHRRHPTGKPLRRCSWPPPVPITRVLFFWCCSDPMLSFVFATFATFIHHVSTQFLCRAL
jgi:hypothetical protein